MVYVQFKDASKKVIVSAFGSPQDAGSVNYYDEIEKEDERYVSFIKSMSSPYPIINSLIDDE